VTLRIGVHSHKQVELAFVDLDHAIQITPFEDAIEHELFFECEGRIHAFECAVEQIRFVKAISPEFLLNRVGLNHFAHVDSIPLQRRPPLQHGRSFQGTFFGESVFLMQGESVNKARTQVVDTVGVGTV
jgi:hypothetical protein